MSEDKGLKQFLVVFNILVVLTGLALAGLGVWILVDSNSFTSIVDNAALNNSTYALIGVGAFIALVGFCGCCGAWKEVKFLLIIYIIIVGLIFLLEVAVGVVIALYQDELESYLQKTMNQTLQEDYGQSGTANQVITDAWDVVQQTFDCCGTLLYTDYQTSAWISGNVTNQWPDSCCVYQGGSVKDSTKCHNSADPDWYDYMNPDGCYIIIRDLLTKNIIITGAVICGFSVIILSSLVGAICLCCSIRKDD
ncbi:tetraspanin-4-like [Ptychodera flava]|uniref:tetraspanin-4-like n=1 Tax=Ptychodera flava TaxID=63121 RepID=UPI00396A8908